MKTRTWTMILTTGVCLVFSISILAQNPPQQGGPMAMKKYDVDPFVAKVDADKDGSMTKDEWKTAGLVEIPFMLCDTSKDGKITAEEMTACELPEAMDGNKDGILMVSEMIEFDKRMAGAPKKKYAATSPYVDCENCTLKDRNHAIWALGQLKDKRALPILYKYRTGKPCDHSRQICQYEIGKAIRWTDGNSYMLPQIWRVMLNDDYRIAAKNNL